VTSPLANFEAAFNGILFGQRQVVRSLLVTILARGHAILEGVPGVGKTLAARALSQHLGLSHKRIQFTPDLMPNDVTGTTVFRAQTGQFEFIKGPVFTEVLIADEINRTPPKTQAALLEAMEERQATIDGVTHALPPHFCVLATQNPLELEGTYPLPEAQLDRFLLRILCAYPQEADEVALLHQHRSAPVLKQPAMTREALKALQQSAADVHVELPLLTYVVSLVRSTRQHPSVRLGASPRAALALVTAAKAHALISGRDYCSPDDVKAMATEVLAHRISIRAESEIDGVNAASVVQASLDSTAIAR
jgi:MoxR-like ATPase